MKLHIVHQDETAVIEGLWYNKIVGPGWVLTLPGEHITTILNTYPKEQSIHVAAVQTRERVPVEITVNVTYKIVPSLLKPFLRQVCDLKAGGWETILYNRAKTVLRKIVSEYSWEDLARQSIQQRLERHFCGSLSDHVVSSGLEITQCYISKIRLPEALQKTIVKNIEDSMNTRQKLAALDSYTQALGIGTMEALMHVSNSVPQVMVVKSDLSEPYSHHEDMSHLALRLASLTPPKEEVFAR